ncbi:MAG: UvrD-like helicase family protein, partial [Chlamydiales bacterium]|nr:UvrD-like helicase family protein [Chlamydiales bacterium]
MSLFPHLNDQQAQAVLHQEGPLLVLAGAGSGKTRVVTERIVRLIRQGVHPVQILGVTFTNKAALEMRERVHMASNTQVLITTFHSLGARILRESIEMLGYAKGFQIYDQDDSEKLIKHCMAELNISPVKGEVSAMKSLISKAKNEGKAPDEVDQSNLNRGSEVLFPSV